MGKKAKKSTQNRKSQVKNNTPDTTPELKETQKSGKNFLDEIKGFISMIICVYGIHLVSGPILFFFYWQIVLNQNYWWVLILIAQQIYQFKFAKKQHWFIKLGIWQNVKNYFNQWEFITEEPIPKENALLGFHPHGIASWGATLHDTISSPLQNILVSRVILAFPFSGMFLRWLGMEAVEKENLVDKLKKNKTFGLIPGGFEEATLTNGEENRVFLKDRKGFVKYALIYGYKIFPCFVFGENKTYSVFQPLLKFRLWLNKYKVPGTFFISKFVLMPERNVDMRTVVGKGIQLPKISMPTKEDVSKYHKIYMDELQTVYDKYQKKFGEKSKLHIF